MRVVTRIMDKVCRLTFIGWYSIISYSVKPDKKEKKSKEKKEKHVSNDPEHR